MKYKPPLHKQMGLVQQLQFGLFLDRLILEQQKLLVMWEQNDFLSHCEVEYRKHNLKWLLQWAWPTLLS